MLRICGMQSVFSRMVAGLAPALVAAALSVAAADAADVMFPPASRIGMAPPAGFVPSAQFPGFQHNDKQGSIIIAELPGYAFETIEKEVAAEMAKGPLAAAGPIDRQPVELKDGGKGFVLFGRPTSPQGPVLKWTLIAQVKNITTVVTALFPEAVQEIASDQAIRDSLATVTVRDAVPVEESLAVLPFSLHQLAGFRIVRVQPGNAVMLTDGPSDAIDGLEQPLLLITIIPAPNQPQPNERDGIARRLLSEIPGLKDVRVTRSEPLRIANQQGHEILLEGKDAKTGTDVNAVQWLRFGSGTLLRMVGVTRGEAWLKFYPRFREVRDGLGPK
jgi:hypothetical protein